jgi:hypothetical protein
MAPVAGTPVTMPCLSKITLNVVQHLKTLTIDTGMKRPQCDALDVAYKVFTTAKMNEYENEPPAPLTQPAPAGERPYYERVKWWGK